MDNPLYFDAFLYPLLKIDHNSPQFSFWYMQKLIYYKFHRGKLSYMGHARISDPRNITPVKPEAQCILKRETIPIFTNSLFQILLFTKQFLELRLFVY